MFAPMNKKMKDLFVSKKYNGKRNMTFEKIENKSDAIL